MKILLFSLIFSLIHAELSGEFKLADELLQIVRNLVKNSKSQEAEKYFAKDFQGLLYGNGFEIYDCPQFLYELYKIEDVEFSPGTQVSDEKNATIVLSYDFGVEREHFRLTTRSRFDENGGNLKFVSADFQSFFFNRMFN